MRPIVAVAIAAAALSPCAAWAGGDVLTEKNSSGLFSNVGLQGGLVTGASPGFGDGLPVGFDLRLAVQSSRAGGFLGTTLGYAGTGGYKGKLGEAPSAAQWAQFQLGGRFYLSGRSSTDLFVGGGGSIGAHYVDTFAFKYASTLGLFGEVGVEFFRSRRGRLFASARVDWGTGSKTEFSRVPAEPSYALITGTIGFFLGGSGTTARE